MPTMTAPPAPRFRDPARVPKPKGQAAREEKSAPAVSDERIAEWLEARTPAHLKAIATFTKQKTRAMGYSQVREGGALWERARREVICDLINYEVDIDEAVAEMELAKSEKSK